MRTLPIFLILTALTLLAGCSYTYNPNPPVSELGVLDDPIQLTHGFEKAGEAYFSPDMQWIVFQAMNKNDLDYHMYVAQLKWDGSPRRIVGLHAPIRVSPDNSWNSCGFFSPDSSSLIFASTGDRKINRPQPATGPGQRSYRWFMPGEAEIYRADNWKAALSALPAGVGTNLARNPLTGDKAYQAECAYSPDGKWIIYCSNQTGDPDLWVMAADGSKQIQLTRAAGYDGGAFFSPEGKRIAYRSDRKNNNLLQIFTADLVFNSAGDITGLANEKQLTFEDQDSAYAGQHPAESAPATRPTGELLKDSRPSAAPQGPAMVVNWAPYWHPDGRHIIWTSSLHGQRNFELYMMRDDGTRKTRITFTNRFDGLPVFSPDGQYLMWSSARSPDTRNQVWIAHFTIPGGL